jgi:hypothetical protein
MKELLVLKNRFVSEDLETFETSLEELKLHDRKKFLQTMNRMKLLFIEIDDIRLLNQMSLLFSSFSIHSAVPLVISKLISGSYDESGGTLIYSLKGLRIFDFKEELAHLWERDISYEMKQMLKLINIPPSTNVDKILVV